MWLLQEEAVERSLLGRLVHPQVEVVTLEDGQLLKEVRQALEAGALDELLLEVEERSLDLALRAGSIGDAGPWLDAVMTAQLQELRVPAEMRWPGVEHERFGVVD